MAKLKNNWWIFEYYRIPSIIRLRLLSANKKREEERSNLNININQDENTMKRNYSLTNIQINGLLKKYKK